MGSSHSFYGIKYPKNVKGYNLGLHSQNFYYDYQILKKYLNKLEEKAIVIIPISIQSFYNERNFIENYIPFLDKKDILYIKNNEYFFGKYFSITQPISRIKYLSKYLLESLYNFKFEKNYITFPPKLNYQKMQESAQISSLEHLGILDKKYSGDKTLGQQRLIDIIKFCEENPLIPILITLPHTYLSNEIIGDIGYQERIIDNIMGIEKNLKKKYLYFDYSRDKEISQNLDYFFDADHLNEKGAEYLTEKLLKDLKLKGYNID